jgi:hypothetical protein
MIGPPPVFFQNGMDTVWYTVDLFRRLGDCQNELVHKPKDEKRLFNSTCRPARQEVGSQYLHLLAQLGS